MDAVTKVSYGSNTLLALLGVFSLQQWAILIGIILSIATFGVNVWYKKRMLQTTKDHQYKMRDIQEKKDDSKRVD